MFDHDEELPAGFQEADLLQAQYEEDGRQYARDVKRGICHHSWQLGRKVPAFYNAQAITEDRKRGNFPERPTDPSVTDQASIPVGQCLCLDCGQLVPDVLVDWR